MSDVRKYYYMRLNESYFDSDEQRMLEAMPDGYLYSNILLKLYLKSLKRDGMLMFTDRIPYNAQMIATITRHQIGTVENALSVFQQLGIVEMLDSGAIFMLDVQEFVGSTTTESDRKRAYRARIKAEKQKQLGTNVQTNVRVCPPEIELELEKEIKIETEIEPEIEREVTAGTPVPAKPTRHKYGQYNNVLLSDDDLDKLKGEFTDWEARIERLSEYIASTGKTYKNHLATIRSWARKDDAKPAPKRSEATSNNPFLNLLKGGTL